MRFAATPLTMVVVEEMTDKYPVSAFLPSVLKPFNLVWKVFASIISEMPSPKCAVASPILPIRKADFRMFPTFLRAYLM